MKLINLHGIGWSTLVSHSIQGFARDRMQVYAAALAFRMLFAIFPFLLFLLAIIGFLGIPEFFEWLRQQAQLALPDAIVKQVQPIVDDLRDRRGGLLTTGIGIALWTASLAVRDLMYAMNNAYDVEESRPFWKMYGIALLTTLAAAFILVATAACMLLGPDIIGWATGLLNIAGQVATVWPWLRWPLIIVLLMLMIALLYYVTPNVEQRFRFLSLGAVIAVAVWIAASIGFSVYVRNFAGYSALYGGIGAVILLLVYFYVSAVVLLLGAEINVVVERAASQGKNAGDRSLTS